MARDIICDLDQVNVAEWMMGNLKTGEQVALCGGCRTAWMLGELHVELSDEAKAAVAAQWAPAPAAASTEGAGDQDAPKRAQDAPGRRRRARGGSEHVEAPPAAPEGVSGLETAGSAEGLAGSSPAADDG